MTDFTRKEKHLPFWSSTGKNRPAFLSLYGKIRVSENHYSCIFFALLLLLYPLSIKFEVLYFSSNQIKLPAADHLIIK